MCRWTANIYRLFERTGSTVSSICTKFRKDANLPLKVEIHFCVSVSDIHVVLLKEWKSVIWSHSRARLNCPPGLYSNRISRAHVKAYYDHMLWWFPAASCSVYQSHNHSWKPFAKQLWSEANSFNKHLELCHLVVFFLSPVMSPCILQPSPCTCVSVWSWGGVRVCTMLERFATTVSQSTCQLLNHWLKPTTLQTGWREMDGEVTLMAAVCSEKFLSASAG